MKQKRVYLFLIALILLSSFILAQSEEQAATEIDKAYACLEENLGDNCGGTRSTKQNSFNLLAASYDSSLQSDCSSSLKEKLKDNVCWGETDTGTCNIKSTALATLALTHIQDDVEDHEDWLLSKRIKDTGLTWFLEIDANNQTECDINGVKVTIEDNKKISGQPPQGLVKSYSNYWFEIKDLEKNYTISCDKDFITALIYQKPGSSVYHVSSETQTASEYDKITEKVNSFCFSTSNICDYEGSLWASLVLAKLGRDTSPYLPFIVSMSDKTENKKYLPSAFIYILTHSDDYYDELVSTQKSNNYWDESRNKFYDTALALLALSDVASDDSERAKRYLISVQKSDGCWPSDTAFILHGAWPKSPTSFSGGGDSISYCGDFGYYCASIGECQLEDTLDNFYCSSSAQVCCEVQPIEPTCSEKGGVECEVDQICSGSDVYSSDSNNCCIGDCIFADLEPECELQGDSCRASCNQDTEEEKTSYSSSCSFGDVCCSRLPPKESGFNIWLIILLAILIILIILAIVFRNQLKTWWAKRKGRKPGKKSDLPPTPGPNLRPGNFTQPRTSPTNRRSPVRRPPTRGRKADSDFDNTMKKLREMSK